MKSVLTACLMICFACVANAQLKGFGLGPYVEYGIPSGDFQQTHKNGYGLGLGADIRLGKWGLTGSAGYIHFGGKATTDESGSHSASSIKAFPIRAGIKYRFIPAMYLKLESGMARLSGDDKSALIISPGIGVRLLGLDLQAKYEIWKGDQTRSFAGLKAGINF